jgi:hypothetical protein
LFFLYSFQLRYPSPMVALKSRMGRLNLLLSPILKPGFRQQLDYAKKLAHKELS